MMDIANKLAEIIYGVAMILPLAWSLRPLIKLLKKKNHSRLFVVPFVFISMSISLFLIFSIFNIFIYAFYELPQPLRVIEIFLFVFYWAGFGGFLYALGVVSGQAGKSPSSIVKEINVNLSNNE